ncbi:hypothetical protein OG241_22980 [Streptomyces sp. NBC_01390]|uniref:hypothetical protein n=1 Tax=Streptomyces sp. NBC_01390 TaxID=2903850 RepID=UPI00324B7798
MVTIATAMGAVMALAGGAQADPGRPNNYIAGDVGSEGFWVKYSTYRTIPASWRNVDIYYDNKPDSKIRIYLRHSLDYRLTDPVELSSTSKTYRLGTGMDAGTEFAITAQATEFMWNNEDHHWGGQLYW